MVRVHLPLYIHSRHLITLCKSCTSNSQSCGLFHFHRGCRSIVQHRIYWSHFFLFKSLTPASIWSQQNWLYYDTFIDHVVEFTMRDMICRYAWPTIIYSFICHLEDSKKYWGAWIILASVVLGVNPLFLRGLHFISMFFITWNLAKATPFMLAL